MVTAIRTSADSAAAFLERQDLIVCAERAATLTRARWAWFRIATLIACLNWQRTTAELMEVLSIPRSDTTRRVALRNLSNMTRNGFLVRTGDGYRTTARGQRVLADLRELCLDNAERAV